MRDDTTTQGVLFNGLFEKPLSARFDQPDSSSDGGAILLKACDKQLGLIDAMASCLRDRRDPERVVHGVRELVQQRVYGMACGYEDCNDSARLRYRWRRGASAAPSTGKTQSPGIFLPHRGRTAARLTRVIRHVQRPCTSRVTSQTGRGRERFINAGKEMRKSGILQYGVAHFGGLLAW